MQYLVFGTGQNTVNLCVSQMYKVYRDPEGKSVMATTLITTMYKFQGSDDMYKEENEKLKKEIANLKKKVSST